MPIIAETAKGQLRIQNDELIMDSKVADAAKMRVGSMTVPGQTGGGGGYSFDIITETSENNRRTEAGVITGTRSHLEGGEIDISIWDGTEPITDESQKKVAEFRVPVKLAGRVAGLPTLKVTRFYTDHGKFCINWQDDTDLPVGVIYRTNGSLDETTWVHVGFVPVRMV